MNVSQSLNEYMEIIEVLMNNILTRKGVPLSQSSIKKYIGTLKLLMVKILDDQIVTIDELYKNEYLIKKNKQIIEKIEKEKKDATKNNYYNALINLLKIFIDQPIKKKVGEKIFNINKKNKKTYENIKNVISARISELTNEIKKGSTTQEIGEDDNKYIDYFEIKKKMDEHYNQIIEMSLEDLEKKKHKYYLFVLLSLYVYNIPRRDKDYTNMKIVDDEDEVDEDDNYYVKSDYTFVFNKYKTASTYGTQFIKIGNEKLKKLIDQYLKINQSDYFIVSVDDNPVSKTSTLSFNVFNAAKEYLGIATNVTSLRKSFVSKFFEQNPNATLKQRTDLAYAMGHSIKKQEEVYKKYKNKPELVDITSI